MAHYLLVADEAATSPLVMRRASEIASLDRRAYFTLLMPASRERYERAYREAAEARAAFTRARLHMVYTEIGDASPVQAIEDELRVRGPDYDAIVLATPPPGLERWLNLDASSRVEREHRLPVFHVFEGGDDAWAATERLRRLVAVGLRRRPKPSMPGAEARAFTSYRELLPIAALLLLHLVLGVGLALRYNRLFFMGEGFVVIFMSALVIGLWYYSGPRTR